LTVEEQYREIQKIIQTDNQIILVAEGDGQLIGYLRATGGTYNRNRHCAYVVIGIRQTFTGQGIGKQLFVELDKWALAHGIKRLELAVMVTNYAALVVYHRIGFEIEGLRRHSIIVDDKQVDEYYMAKLL
jgi:RimJ/RimL family protein N-acetyltransferase